MLGNGFAWGQSSHLFAFLYRILDVQPLDVHCRMTHSESTGADVSFSATVRCEGNNDGPVMSVSETSLLGGNAHSNLSVPMEVRIDVFGTHGSLHYGGNDRDANSTLRIWRIKATVPNRCGSLYDCVTVKRVWKPVPTSPMG